MHMSALLIQIAASIPAETIIQKQMKLAAQAPTLELKRAHLVSAGRIIFQQRLKRPDNDAWADWLLDSKLVRPNHLENDTRVVGWAYNAFQHDCPNEAVALTEEYAAG